MQAMISALPPPARAMAPSRWVKPSAGWGTEVGVSPSARAHARSRVDIPRCEMMKVTSEGPSVDGMEAIVKGWASSGKAETVGQTR